MKLYNSRCPRKWQCEPTCIPLEAHHFHQVSKATKQHLNFTKLRDEEHKDDVSHNFLSEVELVFPPYIERVSSSTPCETSTLITPAVQEFLMRGWRLSIIDKSIWRKIALWVILHILIHIQKFNETEYASYVNFWCTKSDQLTWNMLWFI